MRCGGFGEGEGNLREIRVVDRELGVGDKEVLV